MCLYVTLLETVNVNEYNKIYFGIKYFYSIFIFFLDKCTYYMYQIYRRTINFVQMDFWIAYPLSQ